MSLSCVSCPAVQHLGSCLTSLILRSKCAPISWSVSRPIPTSMAGAGPEISLLGAKANSTLSLRSKQSSGRSTRPNPERPSPSVWSALEYGCHVRDVHRLYDTRLALMLTVDGPHYPNWDQDETAVADRYAEQDPAEVAAGLQQAAEALAARFDGVSGDQWQRTGVRSDGVRFTVESFARYYIHDPVHHLYDVSGVRHAAPDCRAS